MNGADFGAIALGQLAGRDALAGGVVRRPQTAPRGTGVGGATPPFWRRRDPAPVGAASRRAGRSPLACAPVLNIAVPSIEHGSRRPHDPRVARLVSLA